MAPSLSRGFRACTDPGAVQVRDLGHDPAVLVSAALDRTLPPPGPDLQEVAQRLFGPEGLTRHQTAFVRRDLTRALADALPTGTPLTAEQLEGWTDRLLAHPDAVPLEAPAPGGERQWTTTDLLATERAALAHAGRVPPLRDIDTGRVADIVAAAGLTDGQRRVAANLALSWPAVQVVIGPAGSGKTTVLATTAACWTAQGRPVLGTALAATTAQRLHDATGIDSASLARLLATADRPDPATGRPRGLPAGLVVVVDEASMVGTRQLARLLEHVAAAGGQTILVGDPAQLPEVEAGGLFTAFAQQPLATHVLHGNARQRFDWEREALVALRNGDVYDAIDLYLAYDRVHLLPTPADLAAQLAADYTANRAAYGIYGVVALASRRADVHRLNEAIRQRLQAHGALGPDALTVTGPDRRPVPLAVGDLVIVTRNDPSTGLLNGTRAELTTVGSKQLALRTEHGRELTVPTGWATGHLAHAYALTVHKAQGLTTETCLLYGTGALCQQAGYVGLSRGREANHLYTTLTGLDADRGPDQPGLQLLHGPDPGHVLDALADRLERAHTHTLASHQQPLEHEPLYHYLDDPPDRSHGIER